MTTGSAARATPGVAERRIAARPARRRDATAFRRLPAFRRVHVRLAEVRLPRSKRRPLIHRHPNDGMSVGTPR
ncbi:hypothetical protein ASF20_12270 [Methylobacterium sp. Leaf88]|nr:hypothetical protein ASF20_12270 [Methylobacterium sp. Leaf88]